MKAGRNIWDDCGLNDIFPKWRKKICWKHISLNKLVEMMVASWGQKLQLDRAIFFFTEKSEFWKVMPVASMTGELWTDSFFGQLCWSKATPLFSVSNSQLGWISTIHVGNLLLMPSFLQCLKANFSLNSKSQTFRTLRMFECPLYTLVH